MTPIDEKRIVIWKSLIFALLLHYFLNPSESGNDSTANLIRFICGGISALFVGAGLHKRRHFELVAYLLGIVCFWFVVQNLGENISSLITLCVWITVSAICAMGLVGGNKNRDFVCALDILMVFWVSAFIVQIALYLVSGTIVDFHNAMHPLSEGRIHELGGVLVRFTGVQTEPGTYANYLYSLVLLRAIVNCNLFDRINLIAMTSVLLSISVWGMVTASIYLVCHCISHLRAAKRNISSDKKYLLVLIIFPMLIYNFTDFDALTSSETFEYLLFRSDLEDESGFSKLLAFDSFMNHLSELIFVGKPIEYNYCPPCVSPQDAGIFINLTMKAGLFMCFLIFFFVGFVYFQNFGILGLIAFLPFLSSKVFYFDPLLWIIIFATCIAFFEKKIKKSISSGLNLNTTYYEK